MFRVCAPTETDGKDSQRTCGGTENQVGDIDFVKMISDYEEGFELNIRETYVKSGSRHYHAELALLAFLDANHAIELVLVTVASFRLTR